MNYLSLVWVVRGSIRGNYTLVLLSRPYTSIYISTPHTHASTSKQPLNEKQILNFMDDISKTKIEFFMKLN